MNLKRVRTVTATLALAALVTLSAAACKNSPAAVNDGASAPPAAGSDTQQNNADPTAALSVAVQKTNSQSFRMTMTMAPEMTMETVVDPVAKKSHGTMEMKSEGFSMSSETILIGDDIYVKTDGPFGGGGDKWMHMSLKGLADKMNMTQQMDPTSFLKQAKNVTQVDANTYKGELDLSEYTWGEGPATKSPHLGSIPFTLVLDGEGRMSHLEMEMKNVGGDGKDRTMVLDVSDYGVPVEVSAPPADKVEDGPIN